MIYTRFSEPAPNKGKPDTKYKPYKKQFGKLLYLPSEIIGTIPLVSASSNQTYYPTNWWAGKPVALITDFLPLEDGDSVIIPETIDGIPTHLGKMNQNQSEYDQFRGRKISVFEVPNSCTRIDVEDLDIKELRTIKRFEYQYSTPKKDFKHPEFFCNSYDFNNCLIETVYYYDVFFYSCFREATIGTVVFMDNLKQIRRPPFDGLKMCRELKSTYESFLYSSRRTGVYTPAPYVNKDLRATVKRIIIRCPRMKVIDNLSFIKGLEYVEIEPGPIEIAPNAFEGNSELKTVILPSTITKVGKNAFGGCHPDLKLDYVQAAVSEWNPDEDFEEEDYSEEDEWSEDDKWFEEELDWDEGNS